MYIKKNFCILTTLSFGRSRQHKKTQKSIKVGHHCYIVSILVQIPPTYVKQQPSLWSFIQIPKNIFILSNFRKLSTRRSEAGGVHNFHSGGHLCRQRRAGRTSKSQTQNNYSSSPPVRLCQDIYIPLEFKCRGYKYTRIFILGRTKILGFLYPLNS